MSMIWLGLYLALDNVLMVFALEPLCRSAAARRWMVGWFAGVDAVAPLLGWPLRGWLVAHGAGTGGAMLPAVALTIVLMLFGWLTVQRLRQHSVQAQGWLLRMVPLLALVLGLDNLAAGATAPLAGALQFGLVGATLIVLAGAAARRVSAALPHRSRMRLSTALLALAVGVEVFA